MDDKFKSSVRINKLPAVLLIAAYAPCRRLQTMQMPQSGREGKLTLLRRAGELGDKPRDGQTRIVPAASCRPVSPAARVPSAVVLVHHRRIHRTEGCRPARVGPREGCIIAYWYSKNGKSSCKSCHLNNRTHEALLCEPFAKQKNGLLHYGKCKRGKSIKQFIRCLLIKELRR